MRAGPHHVVQSRERRQLVRQDRATTWPAPSWPMSTTPCGSRRRRSRPGARGHPLRRRRPSRPHRQRLPLRPGRRLDRQSRALDIARNVRTGTFSITGAPLSVRRTLWRIQEQRHRKGVRHGRPRPVRRVQDHRRLTARRTGPTGARALARDASPVVSRVAAERVGCAATPGTWRSSPTFRHTALGGRAGSGTRTRHPAPLTGNPLTGLILGTTAWIPCKGILQGCAGVGFRPRMRRRDLTGSRWLPGPRAGPVSRQPA